MPDYTDLLCNFLKHVFFLYHRISMFNLCMMFLPCSSTEAIQGSDAVFAVSYRIHP